MLALAGATAAAQAATFRGLVLADSTERPIAGVTVTIDELKLRATTDSLGRFAINGIAPGSYAVSAKRIGFSPLTTRMLFNRGAAVEADFLLTVNAQALPEVNVATRPVAPLHGKLSEFEARRLEGHGRFLSQADLEKRPFAVLSNALRTIPGLELKGRGRDMWVAAGRMSIPAGVLAGGNAGGPPPPCPAAIVLDGVMVYGAGDANEPKFAIDQISPSVIAGIEYYVGPATIPVKWNATRHTCGLLAIWTK